MTKPPTGGRGSKGGGQTPAPLDPHPASQIFPSMSDDEFKGLCEDITEHGLMDDILLLDGQILEGNNRYQACVKVGVKPRTMDWVGDDPVSFVLSKNLHRRHLSLTQKAAVAVEAEHLYEKAARSREVEGGRVGGQSSGKGTANLPDPSKGQALEHAAKAVGVSRRSAQDAKKIKTKSPETFNGMKKGAVKSVRSGLKQAGLHPGGPKGGAKKAKAPAKKEVPEHIAAQARIRQSDAETKYQSMINAPVGKLNLPFLDRASKIQELLVEVAAITPEKAASGVPALRCREFSLEMAKWWLEFASIMEDRRQAETPDLAPIYKRGRLAAISTVAHGAADLPKEERHLGPTEKAALDWLRQQSEPVTVTMVAVGLRSRRDHVSRALRVLCRSDLAKEVGRVDRAFIYEAVRQDDGT